MGGGDEVRDDDEFVGDVRALSGAGGMMETRKSGVTGGTEGGTCAPRPEGSGVGEDLVQGDLETGDGCRAGDLPLANLRGQLVSAAFQDVDTDG